MGQFTFVACSYKKLEQKSFRAKIFLALTELAHFEISVKFRICWYPYQHICMMKNFFLLPTGTVHSRVGWFWTFFYNLNKSTPEICYIPTKSTENSKTKFVVPVTASSLVTTFWVMYYIRVQKFFFTIWTSWGSKDAEFYVDFKI
jgi:hypothetical protein